MKTLGNLLALAWLVSTVVFLANGMIPVAMICTGALSLLALLFSCKAKDVTRERCFCFFGGLIICVFLGVLSAEEFSWGHLFQTLFVTGLCSIPVVIFEPISRRQISEYLFQTLHLPSIGGTPEGCAQGLIVWIIVTGFALFGALLLGFGFVALMYFLSLSLLISLASNPFKSNSPSENSESAPADNTEKKETQKYTLVAGSGAKPGILTTQSGSASALNQPEDNESKEEDLNITWL